MGSVIVGPSCDVLEVKESCLCVIHTVHTLRNTYCRPTLVSIGKIWLCLAAQNVQLLYCFNVH